MNLKTIFTFSLGAAVGSVITWKLIKDKYEKLAQDEIESVKDVFAKLNAEDIEDAIDAEPITATYTDTEKPDVREYAAILTKEGYSETNENEEKSEEYNMPVEGPYVISPDEFGEYDDYEPITLVYFADGVLVDEENEPMTDEEIEYYVGRESLDHFGEYEEDSVHVRNEITKGDYEILRDLRNYSDVYGDESMEG